MSSAFALYIRGDYATPWLFVREGRIRLWRLEWHVAYLDSLVAGRFVTFRIGGFWPRLLPRTP